MSDGMVQMTAENDINIVNDKDTMYTETIKNKKGTFSSYSLEEKDYKEGAVASTIVGNNVILDAGNNINVRASNVIAVKDPENMGGNIIATAGNDINILADTLNNEYSRKEKKSGFSVDFSNAGGGMSAGVSYNKNSLEQTSNNTVVAVSTLMSEGSTVLDAGNRVRTEAMQANVGEDLIIRGVNGVDLLDATETYEEKTKQKSSSIGITASIGSTVTSFISTANEVSGNDGKYGFDNKSQLINTYGDGLGLFRDTMKAGGDISQTVIEGMKGTLGTSAEDLANYGISANVSLNYSQSKYESNTSGTRSVAGEINVGGNMIVESEGDVRFVNQKINVGENLIIDAKSFEALAGKNTFTNDTKSSSAGASVGYDFIGETVTGGINGSKGNSNTTSTSYDNTIINTGGTFQLTTKEDATFKGANITSDKLNFEIGGNLNVISLQDEYNTHGKNVGGGIDYGHGEQRNSKGEMEGYNTPIVNVSYGQSNGDAKWVSDQTSIVANNGGTIKVNETLTNTGAIIASINEPLNIEAKKLVTEDLKDYNEGRDYNIGLSGMDRKNPIPQPHLNYESHDKEQDTNATFSNVVVTENGTKVDFEARGINTDLTKAQVVTKDEVVDPIDTDLHTDLLNPGKREELANDTKLFVNNIDVIGTSIAVKLDNNKTGDPNAEMSYKEKQTLANITKVTEQVVKNRENLVLSETDRESKEKLQEAVKDKYAGYGVTDVIIIKDGEELMGTDGKMHKVNGAFSLDGVIYITESTANGTLKDLNRIVGEEVGEIYAHNNGLEKNGNAQQLGEIFGEKLSNGVGETTSKNSLTADNIDLSKVVIDGTNVFVDWGIRVGIKHGTVGMADGPLPIVDLILLAWDIGDLVVVINESTKNDQKANEKRVAESKKREEALKKELEELKKKPNKTPEGKKKREKIEKAIKKEKALQQKSENHSRTGKHS